jgi:hypothetical protein
MELSCQGEPTGFANQKEADTFGLHLLAQIRYQMCVDPRIPYDLFSQVKEICQRLQNEIKGDYEAILDRE